MPHLRKRLPTLRHLLMKPSLRTGRIANFSSSMPPLIDGLRRLTGFHVQRRHLWCRRGRASPPPSSQATPPILPHQPPPKSPEKSFTPPPSAPPLSPQGRAPLW